MSVFPTITPIKTDGLFQSLYSSLFSSSSTLTYFSIFAFGLTITIISSGRLILPRFNRKNSLMSLFILFLVTALPTFLLATIPILGPAFLFSLQMIVKFLVLVFLAFSLLERKSALLKSRNSFARPYAFIPIRHYYPIQSASFALSLFVSSISSYLPRCSSESGNHAFFFF